ncbi:MAG TPA: LAGLIDADG family homing endonuclease [Candidatus Limnocylindria bacterium]|nr:LAGLIDADG family homing endonuclease [Candidatus Limnocylindria bacterium]
MTIRCTPDHPVFTQRGWVNAEDLVSTDFVAVVRSIECGTEAVLEHQAALLGYALSEGSLGYDSHFYLYSSVGDEIEDMRRVVATFDNTLARVERRVDGKASSVRPARGDRARPSEAVEFLFGTCALRGANALTKRVPLLVDRWNLQAIAILVGKLFQGDGCVHMPTRWIFYATSSEGLARDVRRLLLKLGLTSTVHRKTFAYRGGHRTGYTVNLLGGRGAYRRFHERIGPHLVGSKRLALADLAMSYDRLGPLLPGGTVDVVPLVLCREPVREAIAKAYPSLKAGCRALGLAYRLLFKESGKGGLRRDTVEYLADKLDSPALHALVPATMGWSRPRGFTVHDIEPTFDIEVPGARSFIANGIAVHNSHAAAYALVAYQTAYFKANYPVEFMAALLTSEMGDTDKIVKYIDECRAMGLTVQPPDVNTSAVQFSVAGDTIRFGLAAIKNVGEAAMESILRTRAAEGAFRTLDDFCSRVDLRLVNRRVIESLIKAGAFDSLGLPRAHLLVQTDAALEGGQRVQRDRAEGQGSFFDDLLPKAPAHPAAGEPPGPIAEEWDADQRLAFEKEVLGFYISGHPLARYAAVVESMGITSTGDLAAKGHGAKVALFGHVGALKETATKSGNRMAFFTLEDMAGTVEVTVFPEPFKAAAPYLRAREPLVVRGRIDDGDKGRVILADDIRILDQSLANKPKGGAGEPSACRIRVPSAGDAAALLAALKQVCEEHPGGVPVFVHVLLDGVEVVVRARGVSVDASPGLTAKVTALMGTAAMVIEYAGRA